MQLKNEEYAPVGTYSHHWNPMMLSPNQLRDELLGQINEKQRQAEALRVYLSVFLVLMLNYCFYIKRTRLKPRTSKSREIWPFKAR